ncbi:viroplasmin family protein [Gemella sp. zg-1178]|uniref:ribonuclease H1 domain-containing protein n=1 Tax=Gemella sp. zg-1178 TaxID=2840372 RepID=UPI001C0507F0|nr:ribonuclease H family protein [Gemella sp. zg-1178]MBU0278144.1 ribonuclease H family protein [Gemella sp. zg-1178]
MAKFYAVKKGQKTGIFQTWEECQIQVKGYKGAIYKAFASLQDAQNFLKDEIKENPNTTNEYETYAFIDGSFDVETFTYGSGIVIVDKGNKIVKKLANKNREIAELRNVAGELEAAKFVMNYALENKIKKIAIYFDYMGIAAWAKGDWQANLDYTKYYASFAKKIMQEVEIDFIKVKAHSGVSLNEEVDKLAKEAILDFKKGNFDKLSKKVKSDNYKKNDDFIFGQEKDLLEIEEMKTKKFKQESFFD